MESEYFRKIPSYKSKKSEISSGSSGVRIFRVLEDGEDHSVKEISRVTGISGPTVRKVISKMRDYELVKLSGIRDTQWGRKPKLYKLDASAHYLIGIDFEIPNLRIGIFDLLGHLVNSRETQLPGKLKDYSDQELADFLINQSNDSIKESNIEESDIAGVGVGAPGIVSNEGFKPFSRTDFDRNFQISSILKSRLHENLIMLNDVDLELISILKEENLLDDPSTIAVFFAIRSKGGREQGVSVGGGVWYKDNLLHANNKSSTEFGHTSTSFSNSTTDTNKDSSSGNCCECGNPNCFESFVNRKLKKFWREQDGSLKILEKTIVEKLRDLTFMFNPTHFFIDLNGIGENSQEISKSIKSTLSDEHGLIFDNSPKFVYLDDMKMKCCQGAAIAILNMILENEEKFWSTVTKHKQ